MKTRLFFIMRFFGKNFTFFQKYIHGQDLSIVYNMCFASGLFATTWPHGLTIEVPF